MAEVLKLVRGAVELSLNAADGFGLTTDGWSPKVAQATPGRIPPYLREEFPLRLRRSSADNVAASMQALAAMQEGAARYCQDKHEAQPVWLYDQMVGETNGRRALVRAIQGDLLGGWHNDYNDPNLLFNTIIIERHPYWEAPLYVAVAAMAAAASAASIVVDYTAAPAADIVGDVPGRIKEIGFYANGAAYCPLDRLWLGLRSANKHGTLANFVPIWECELGTLGTDATLEHDATASPGGAGHTVVRITPGTATWAKRLTISLNTITVNTADNLGFFLWLLRALLSAGTWEIQLRWGYLGMADADFVRGPVVAIGNTSWDYYPAGPQVIPVGSKGILEELPVAARGCSVQVWARRITGAGTLDLDCLCPLPIDEGYWIGSKIGFTNPAAEEYRLYTGALANDRPWSGVVGFPAGVQTIYATPVIQQDNFALPIGDGRLVVVYARAASCVLTDQIELSLGPGLAGGFYYPRWSSLRGAE